MPAGGHVQVRSPELGSELARWQHRFNVLAFSENGPEFERRGWDPNDPWDDGEARERARRYWPLGDKNVLGWFESPKSIPSVLLLGIPDKGKTVVRYAWEIDPEGRWEYYPEITRWGVPLGRRIHEHRVLGRALCETRNGKRVQVLLGHLSGCRTLQV